MKNISRILSLAIGSAAAMLASITPAQALTWTGSVVYYDGGTLTGSFDYDSNTDIGAAGFSNVDLTLTIGTSGSQYSSEYSPFAEGMVVNFNDSSIDVNGSSGESLSFNTSALINNGTDLLTLGGFVATYNIGGGWYTPGDLTYAPESPNLGSEYGFSLDGLSTQAISGTFSSSSAPVPFDIPYGATIPALGSVLVIGVMRKARKFTSNNISNTTTEKVN